MSRKRSSPLNQRVIKQRLAYLNHVFTQASVGNFSEDIPIPGEKDEFTELYVGIQVMLEALREKIAQLEAANATLDRRVQEKNIVLDALTQEKNNLAEAKLNIEAVLQSAGEGLMVIDVNQYVVIVNRVAAAILGRAVSTIVGQKTAEVVQLFDAHDRLIPFTAQALYRALIIGKKVSQTAVYCQHQDGSRIPLMITATPVLQGQEIIGAIQVIRDVSREQELEQAKTDFISLASHQLRTPLTTINWYVERILHGKTGRITPLQEKYLATVHESSKRMAQLVQALLNVSRVQLKTFNLKPVTCDVPELVESVVKELQPQITEKNLRLEKQVATIQEQVYVNPKLLRIILQTLLSNAIKYTDRETGVFLKIALQPSATSKAETILQIEVTDSGCGIPQKDQAKIFEKLFRASNVKNYHNDGMGLGLYLVKTLLEYASGKIWFESQEGNGSHFFVTLPLTKYSAVALAETETMLS
ncbi:MAG: ATP-binding protein [Candidatus Andersenbacteria bacterium]